MSIETDSEQTKKTNPIGVLGQALNYDFCPQFNQYVYWLKKPFGWVMCGAGFSALVGFLIGPQGFVLMWAFLALLLIGAVWPWLGMKGITCQLHFDDARTSEGQPTKAILEVSNRWPIPLFGLTIEGEFLQDIETEDDRIAVGLQRIPGWSVCRFEWEFEPERRGLLPSEEPRIANGFPFGIYRSERVVELSSQTIVWPRKQHLKGHPEVNGEQFNSLGILSDRVGEDGEVIGIRPFREGDSIRSVHWQKSAATQELVIKERQKLAQRPIELVVDLTPATHRGRGSKNSYEWAIRIAANICRQLHLKQSQVNVVCLGLEQDLEARCSNRQGMTPLLDFLAMLPPLDSLDSKGNPEEAEAFQFNPHLKSILVCTDKSSMYEYRADYISFVMAADTFEVETQVSAERIDESTQNIVLSLDNVTSGVEAVWGQACG